MRHGSKAQTAAPFPQNKVTSSAPNEVLQQPEWAFFRMIFLCQFTAEPQWARKAELALPAFRFGDAHVFGFKLMRQCWRVLPASRGPNAPAPL
jgi:hypothetical protein